MIKLLVIEGERKTVDSLEKCLIGTNLHVSAATSGRQGLEFIRTQRPDVVLLDIRLPDQDGLRMLEEIQAYDPRLPVILMTAFARSDSMIQAMSRGAFDYLIKPVDRGELQGVIRRALECRQPCSEAVSVEGGPHGQERQTFIESTDLLIGNCAAMHEVYKSIGRIATLDAPVLILGESGTGKELVARAIYEHSARRSHPFLAINCAALPESLLESELFGHEKGAFTGADQRRIGKFEQVHGGTIFLDEIGDMTPGTQAKALRVLQEQCFERVGGNHSVRTDVRILAATNQNLPERVREGRFRLDLFYRLNGFTIHLPPLRHRRDDIPLLAEHFLRTANRDSRRRVVSFSTTAIDALVAHDWPGNVRELQSAVRYAVIHTAGDVAGVDSLPLGCRGETSQSAGSSAHLDAWEEIRCRVQQLLEVAPGEAYRRLLEEFDAIVLDVAWERSQGNQARMSELLGISRMTLRAKLRACGLLPSKGFSDGP